MIAGRVLQYNIAKSCSAAFSTTVTAAEFVPETRKRLIESIVRVDHAGELSADRIYAGQLSILGNNPDVAPVIEHMWEQEREHLDIMERLLAANNLTPTIFAPLCSLAGYALGASTAMIGEKGAMACTIAVEELIGGHYNEQIKELVDDDPIVHADLLQTLSRLRDEEMGHHDTGVAYKGLEAPFYQTLKNVIQTGCKCAIWVTKRI